MKDVSLLIFMLAAISATAAVGQPRPQGLKVSDNRRFLVHADGTPFFYLGDTAWELFHRLNREEADRYLADRAGKGFTVIQAVALAELDGLADPNPYGERPLVGMDPAHPNDAYFRHVDHIVNRANSLGMYVGMLPTWGDKVGDTADAGGPHIFTPENARAYGEFLGRRYHASAIIWILGGDRPPDTDRKRAIWRAMAEGLRQGDGGSHLITFHPPGGHSSGEWLHDEAWLDFNMWQTGHNVDTAVWDRITRDYSRTPTKPVVDGEPLYEDHPIAFNARERGYSSAADVRKSAYWDILAGACGFTYGNHSVWQMSRPEKTPINGPLNTWIEALDHPGAGQMRHVRALFESRPFLALTPDQQLLASEASAGGKRIQAARAADGRYAILYVPASRSFRVDMKQLSGSTANAWWYNPRTGRAVSIGAIEHSHGAVHTFTPPDPGENIDWVLVLDDAAARFPAPGVVRRR